MYKQFILFSVLILVVACSSYSNRESQSESYLLFPTLKNEFRGHLSRNLLAASDDYKQRGVSSFAKARAAMPRYNSKFQRVSNEFEPTDMNYWESIAMMMLVGFIIALVTAVTACCFCCWRCCCGFCGGKDPRPDGYSTLERWVPKIFIFVFTALIVAAAIFGWVGNSGVTKAVNDLFDEANRATGRVINITNDVSIKLNSVQDIDPTEFQEGLNSLRDGSKEIKQQVKVAQDYFNQYNKYREIALQISFVLAAVSAAIGVFGAIFNKSVLCKILFVAACVSLVVQWVSFGIHLSASTVMSDVCLALDRYIDDAENQNSTGLNEILRCLQDATYNPLQTKIDQETNNTLAKINDVTESCCNISFTYETMRNINITSFPPLFQPVIAQYNNDLQNYLSIVDDLLNLSNCSYVNEAYLNIRRIICTDMVNALTIIMGCNGVIGIVFVGLAILAIIGWKRFPPEHENNEENDDEWEEFRESSKPTHPSHYGDEESNIEMTNTPQHYQPNSKHTTGYQDEELPPYSSQMAMPTNYAPIDANHPPGTPRDSVGLYPDIPDEPDFNPSAPMQTITRDQLSDEDMERLRQENNY